VNFKKISFISIIFGVLTACATPVEIPNVINATISNHSNTTIENIYFQQCSDTENMWQSFSNGPINAQEQIEIPLMYSCINLKAVDKNGKTVAKQWNIKNQYPFSWKIR